MLPLSIGIPISTQASTLTSQFKMDNLTSLTPKRPLWLVSRAPPISRTSTRPRLSSETSTWEMSSPQTIHSQLNQAILALKLIHSSQRLPLHVSFLHRREPPHMKAFLIRAQPANHLSNDPCTRESSARIGLTIASVASETSVNMLTDPMSLVTNTSCICKNSKSTLTTSTSHRTVAHSTGRRFASMARDAISDMNSGALRRFIDTSTCAICRPWTTLTKICLKSAQTPQILTPNWLRIAPRYRRWTPTMETVPLQSQVIRHLIWIRLLNNHPKWAWLTLQTLSQDRTHYKSWSSVPAFSHSSLPQAMQMAAMNLHSTKRSQSQLTTTTWVLSLTTEQSCHSLRASWMLSRWSSPLGYSPPSSSHLETARSSLSPLTTPCSLSEMQYMLAWLVCVLARWLTEGSNMHKLKLCPHPLQSIHMCNTIH